ncbi:MAG: hypothetical protein ACI8ZM_000332, partial [Crocinitomix sp.]
SHELIILLIPVNNLEVYLRIGNLRFSAIALRFSFRSLLYT